MIIRGIRPVSGRIRPLMSLNLAKNQANLLVTRLIYCQIRNYHNNKDQDSTRLGSVGSRLGSDSMHEDIKEIDENRKDMQTKQEINTETNENNNKEPAPLRASFGDKMLPSESEAQRSNAAKWLDSKMDKLQLTMFVAGQKINDVTGYSAIEDLKRDINTQEQLVKQYRRKVRACKAEYSEAVKSRSSSQREINQLLQRKHLWSPDDLQRFTDLYRSDHVNESKVEETSQEAEEFERKLEDAQQELVKLISTRYREEQAWSDKIRRASTWGTWSLMGLNVILFLVVQLGLEPWKRRRLVKSFEQSSLKSFEELLERERQLQLQDNTEPVAVEPLQVLPITSSDDENLLTQDLPTTDLSWPTLGQRLGQTTVQLRPQEVAALGAATAILGSIISGLLFAYR